MRMSCDWVPLQPGQPSDSFLTSYANQISNLAFVAATKEIPLPRLPLKGAMMNRMESVDAREGVKREIDVEGNTGRDSEGVLCER